MGERENLRSELLHLIETHKEGFKSGTPEAKRIEELMYALEPHSLYPQALNHPDVFGGRWLGAYWSIGAMGGGGAEGQGTGAETTLNTFSMGRFPKIPVTFSHNALEADPTSGQYNFISYVKVGAAKVDSHLYTLGSYRRDEKDLSKFFVQFEPMALRPADGAMPMQAFCAAIGVDGPHAITAEMQPRPKLYSSVIYMDDEIRVQIGMLGGHYVLKKSRDPMVTLAFAA